ncbi:MAG: hypothetical protein ABMA64_21590 [Myxococcota bacterium]
MDHLWVPADRDLAVEAGHALIRSLRAAGILDGDRPGPHGAQWADRFDAIRVDDPGAVVLYANGVGGFRPACPVDRAPIVPAFSAALTGWRAGGPFSVACPACGETHPLDALDLSPAAAFGRFAIRTIDPDPPLLSPDAERWVVGALGPCHPVLSRVGWR